MTIKPPLNFNNPADISPHPTISVSSSPSGFSGSIPDITIAEGSDAAFSMKIMKAAPRRKSATIFR
jgi:hypothetical protein